MWEFIKKCLSINPIQRPNKEDLPQELARAFEGLELMNAQESQTESSRSDDRRRRESRLSSQASSYSFSVPQSPCVSDQPAESGTNWDSDLHSLRSTATTPSENRRSIDQNRSLRRSNSDFASDRSHHHQSSRDPGQG